MPLFIPSLVANIVIAFDESLTLVTGQPLLSSVETKVRAGGTFSERMIAQAESFSKSNNSFVLNRVPKKASVELPGFRQAGSFSLSFDFREFPIDPRTIRSSTVNIHLGTVDPKAFAMGVTNFTEFQRSRPSILDTSQYYGSPYDETLLVTGYVDEWHVRHGSNGSEVSINGRDARAPLLDTPVGGNPQLAKSLLESLDYSKPIHELINQMFSFHPFFKGFQTIIDINEWDNHRVPSPAEFGLTHVRHRQGAKGTKGGKADPPGGGGSTSFWDIIVRLCFLVGALPTISGTKVIIRPVRRLYDQQRAGLDPTIVSPFHGGRRAVDSVTGQVLESPLRIRRLIYGRDIEELSFDRKFGGYQRPKTVRAIGGDDSPGKRGKARVVMAIWPPREKTKSRASRVDAAGKTSMEDFLDYPVPGIRDQGRLLEIAQAIYEELGRGEVGGSCSTPNLASFGGDNTDPDLLRLRPGDAVELAVDTQNLRPVAPVVSEFVTHHRESFEERVANLARRIGDPQLARVIVPTSRGQVQELISFFRTSRVSYDWSSNEGIKVDFDFQNYVGRYLADKDKPSGRHPRVR